MKRILIKYPGLGDLIFYNSIFKHYGQNNGFRFHAVIDTAIRSSDYLDLTLANNPYVMDISYERSATDCRPITRRKYETPFNAVDQLAAELGFPTVDIISPWINYQPKILQSFKNSVILNFDYVSYVGEIDLKLFRRFIKYFISQHKSQKFILFPSSKNQRLDEICLQTFIEMNVEYSLSDRLPLTDYIDILASAWKSVHVTSGMASVIYALGLKNVMLIHGEYQKSIFWRFSQYCPHENLGVRNLPSYANYIWHKFLRIHQG